MKLKKRLFKLFTILLLIITILIIDTLFQRFVPNDITNDGMAVINNKGQLFYGNYEKYILKLTPHFFYFNQPVEKGPRSYYKINSSGFRGDELSKEKGNKTRIIFIGGSTIFVWKIKPFEKTICGKFSKLDDSLEVVNAGCPGFTSSQELSLYLFKIYEYNPDILISFGGWNDLHESTLVDSYEGTNSFYHWIFEHDFPKFLSYKYSIKEPLFSGLLNLLIKSNILKMIYLKKKNKETKAYYEKYYTKGYEKKFSNDNIQKSLAILKSNILHFKDLSKVKGFKFIYVIQPEIMLKKIKSQDEIQITQKNEILFRSFSPLYQEYVKELEKFLQEQNINYINLNSSQIFTHSKKNFFIDSIHLNEAGGAIVAEIIFEYLHNNNILD